MALCNKFTNILRQSFSQQGGALLNAVRCMSSESSKLFIGGLSYGTDDHSLKDAFSSFGEVVEARVITDRDSGRSRGFGFVSYESTESASSALSAMDGKELQGRNIRVSYAAERSSSGPTSYGGGGRGGYGSSSSFGGRGGDDSY